MSSFEEDSGPFTSKGSSNDSDKNSTNTGRSPVKNIRFGLTELGIFFGMWVIMIIAFKLYTRSQKKTKRGGWFGENEEKKIYEELLATDPDGEEALKKALVRRCMTDVRRMMKLQEERDSVMSLSRSGALPEEMLVDFKAAEKELELELFEVQAEAETFKEGWSNEIVRDSARLLKIEEELLDIKRRKEQHERKKIDDEQAAKDATRVQRQPQLGEEEKKKLLEELLEGEAQDSNSKVRKRNSGGSGKK